MRQSLVGTPTIREVEVVDAVRITLATTGSSSGLGGLAVGLIAAGGAAFGWVAAIGGLAVARDVAFGGLTAGAHANDAAAREFFQQPVALLVVKLLKQSRWLWLLLLIPIIGGCATVARSCHLTRAPLGR
jgi:hypothetical protein